MSSDAFNGEGNFFEGLTNDVLSGFTQYATGGFVNFKDGKFTTEDASATNAVKEVTGAKAAEDANKMAQKQIDEAKAKAETDRKNAITAQAQSEMRSSQMAAAARKTTSNKSGDVTSGTGSLTLGDDEKDFLGL